MFFNGIQAVCSPAPATCQTSPPPRYPPRQLYFICAGLPLFPKCERKFPLHGLCSCCSCCLEHYEPALTRFFQMPLPLGGLPGSPHWGLSAAPFAFFRDPAILSVSPMEMLLLLSCSSGSPLGL